MLCRNSFIPSARSEAYLSLIVNKKKKCALEFSSGQKGIEKNQREVFFDLTVRDKSINFFFASLRFFSIDMIELLIHFST